MPISDETTFQISTKGGVSAPVVERARERLGRVGTHCREPITHVELRVTIDKNHPGAEHARAEATLEVKHGPVRAHESAPTVDEAIDGMIERLRRRLDRHESRLHRIGSKRHNGVAANGSWHHADVSSAPRHPAPLHGAPTKVVRRKSFATSPMTVEEAAFDLDVLDHDFYLFQEADSGAIALLSRAGDGRLRLEIPKSAAPPESEVVPVDQVDGPILLDLAGARRILDAGNEPFIFHRVSEDHCGQVLYRRFDGDYGMIEVDV